MPFIPVAQVVKLIVSSDVAGETVNNIFHVQLPSPATVADVNYLAAAVLTSYQNRFKTRMTTAIQIDQCEAVALDSSSAPAGVSVSPLRGTITTATSVPNNVSGILSWKTPLRYRGGHPRSYMPGLSQGDLDDQRNWTLSATALLAAAGAGFRTDLNAMSPPDAGVADMCVVHYSRAHVALTPPQIESIIGVQAEQAIGSQRRRLGR